MTTTLKNGAPTMKDIAQVCGVSEATVSYVINGKRNLPPDTREKVFRVVKEMNYHPSAVARGLASKRVHTLGILFGVVDPVEFMTNTYASSLLQGMATQAQREGFNLTLFTSRWEGAEVSAPPLRDGRTDGILVVAPPLNSDILDGIADSHLPIVAVSAELRAGMAVVDVDNYAGARMATEHLLQLGHRRIAYLTGNDDLASYAPRRAGFLEALSDAGVEPVEEFVQMSHFDGSLAFEQASRLLRLPEPPTAIFAGNDTIALAVIEAARCQGVNVPQQLSVVGFDDIPVATLVTPNLTTIRQPLRDIGMTAIHLLIESVRQPKQADTRSVFLPPELMVRGSTGPVLRRSSHK